MSTWGMDGPSGNPAGDSEDQDYPNSAAPSDNPAYDVPIHDSYRGLHIHPHSAGPDGEVHQHLHDHAGDGSHAHDHPAHAAVDYYDVNGIPLGPRYDGETSSSGRQPEQDVRRRFNVPQPGLGAGGSLSSRLAAAESDVEVFELERRRVEDVLADLEAEISTAANLAERADLGRVWKELADAEQEARTRMRRLTEQWNAVAADFSLRDGGGRTSGAAEDAWERRMHSDGLNRDR